MCRTLLRETLRRNAFLTHTPPLDLVPMPHTALLSGTHPPPKTPPPQKKKRNSKGTTRNHRKVQEALAAAKFADNLDLKELNGQIDITTLRVNVHEMVLEAEV